MFKIRSCFLININRDCVSLETKFYSVYLFLIVTSSKLFALVFDFSALLGENLNNEIAVYCYLSLSIHLGGLRWCSDQSTRLCQSCTSEVAGSILSENVLNVTQTQCSTHVKRVSQCSAGIVGFLQALRFPPTRNLRINRVG